MANTPTLPTLIPFNADFFVATAAPWLGGFRRPKRLRFALGSPPLRLTLGLFERLYLTVPVKVGGVMFTRIYCQVPFGRH